LDREDHRMRPSSVGMPRLAVKFPSACCIRRTSFPCLG
jgi:hypothetical protein